MEFTLPELGARKQGKVRDLYEKENQLFFITTDRISIFDRILKEPILEKGRILTQIALFWFEHTKDIIPNHIISNPDPNVLMVKKCTPIPIEVIVRGYATGSLWRDYAKGLRSKCGISLPEGLKQNDPLAHPIITPTTKNAHGHDEDISKEEILKQEILSSSQWQYIEQKALQLFQRGCDLMQKRGMVLVDTKYEFGFDQEGHILLIDEVHTPDSSRMWMQNDIQKKEVRFLDKEFVREWGRKNGFAGEGAVPPISLEMQDKIHKNYCEIYQAITGTILQGTQDLFPKRMFANLKKAGLIRGTFVLMILGSEKDKSHAEKMASIFQQERIPYAIEIASAHKQTRKLLDLLEFYNQSLEPVICITIAGRSNALSGVVACNLKWPVIACPFFQDSQDYLVNIHSSLQMPSNVPVLTAIDPHNAALAAMRILNHSIG